ncbi:hypothetical protein [Mucilaginibacter aquaedulcis]|uniref:hypothetical protein n=1 Tax=Mucilaginibacter aquaedulcis TaxID=1187081 RepID=UPI0025B42694|nr:hypothetical protein [Mucilaginibacter aquaedulcis]MDN3549806.1 hypothetical protein [Mucilaginibacter aquaedulcis]
MKTIIFLSLAGCLALCSCSKIIHPHEEVMSSFKTKDDVKKQFGTPDEKRELNEVTEWLYNCDTISAFAASKTKVRMHGTLNNVYGTFEHPSTDVNEFTHYIHYVKFDFDKKGKVIDWDSKEVNFAQKRISIVKTAALVMGVGIVISLYAWHEAFAQLGKPAK